MVLAALLAATAAGAAEPTGLTALDLRYLPLLRNGRAHLASSTDPSGGNDDRGHYLRQDGPQAVLMEADGPGMITRIWSANPQGRLSVYFDHETTARVSLPFDRLAEAGPETPTVDGFCSAAGGGVTCWFPMAFARHCKVTVEGAEQLYYQINYTTWPDTVKVETFKPGPYHPPEGMEWGEGKAVTVQVAPGGDGVLFDLRGPATVRRLVLTVSPNDYDTLRQLVLSMQWDSAPGPSVAAPLLDLFASGLGAAQFLSAPMAVGEWDFLTVDFPLPFATRGVARLSNRGSRSVKVDATAYVTPGRRADDGYFHARYRAAETLAGRAHTVLDIAGRGHYVGTIATLRSPGELNYLEGDEQITVDGHERLFGTGTEDYFNGAWFFRRGPFSELLAGAPMIVAGKSALCAYRWHLADTVPFRTHLTVALEHGPRNDAPGCEYRTVGLWYGAQPTVVPIPTPPDRPAPYRERVEGGILLEAEDLRDRVRPQGVQYSAIDDARTPLPASGGRLLQVVFEAPEGSSIGLPFSVKEAGLYQFLLRVASGGPTFQLLADVDGEALPPPVSQPWLGEPILDLGRARVEAGEHVLTVGAKAIDGGSGPHGRLGMDYLWCRPVGKVPGAIEAESLPVEVRGADAAAVVQTDRDLPVGVVRSAGVIGGGLPDEAVWSGGAQLRFTPGREGDACTLTFEVANDGEYGLCAGFSRGPEYGACEVLLDGRRLLGGDDAFSGQDESDVVGERVPLGVHHLTAGSHRLTLRSVARDGKVRAVGLDYLLLSSALRGHEAELLRRAGRFETIVKVRFGAEPRWSGQAYVRVPGGGPTPPAFYLDAPRSGRYRVTVTEARIPTGGRFSVALGAKTVGRVECAASGEQLGSGMSFEARLRRGANRLAFVAEDNGDLALDVVQLEYLGGGAPLWLWLTLALVAAVAVLLRNRGRR